MTTETLPEVQPIETREHTASDVLLAAARYIEEHGWCQGTITNGGAVCVVGGIKSVSGMPLSEGDWLNYPLTALAVQRLRLHLRTAPSCWNDTSGRTREQVLAALREAAR